ncbi:MAG TPA: sigma-54-dependent Fis family transcriptional regulator, partial [Thermosipho africanus]|nr:sigma-54-dependent Fis family transcriptional regulator [Thermosipho africanus]
MIKLKESAEHFAKGPSNIFIQGKSGTGKEMFARAIHNASLVSNGPFIVINCAAIPENLMESELFGHKEGAFTGSMKGGQVGKFQLADKGTLFLDEIGEMPIHLQPKLLRAIQEKRIQPIGSNEYKIVNIRIIAATNISPEKAVEKKQLRGDLYYRLNVVSFEIPSLNKRKDDIPILANYFIEKFNKLLGKKVKRISE